MTVATTRQELRVGVAEFFGGVEFDVASRIYRPTPLIGYGLAGVRPYIGKRYPDSDYTHGLPGGRGMGAVGVLHLPRAIETRDSFGGATSGIKLQRHTVQLLVYHFAQVPHSEDAQADLDDLLDAIVARMHGDRTLGGCCIQAGEGAGGQISVDMDPPVLAANEAVQSTALVAFNADLYPAA